MLKGEPYTIIGVLSENATTPLNADLYTALQATRDGEGQGTNFELIARLRDGATWLQANGEMNRALARSLRVQNFAKNNPGAQRAYYFVPLQKSETNGRSGPRCSRLMLCGRIHSAHCLCKPCGTNAGTHVAAHGRNSHSTGTWRITLADSKTALD